MRAVRVYEFGGPDQLLIEQIARPVPKEGEALIEVHAAGVGPWDAWIRSGRSVLPQPLPLTPGSDISGVVVATDSVDPRFAVGKAVFGVTNHRFTGGYAEYAVASTQMLAPKPEQLSHIEAASVPVVAVTAQQMLFKHAQLTEGQQVLIHGAAGNVGAYAVQLARAAGLKVFASAYPNDFDFVRGRGAHEVLEIGEGHDSRLKAGMDAVLDTVGGDMQPRLFEYVRPGGIVVSAVSDPDSKLAQLHSARAKFFLVDVNTRDLSHLGDLLQSRQLKVRVGEVLPLTAVRQAHEILDGLRPKVAGKIVLRMR
jgi:NADPH:quinone reductase-like Zn-dependent oxidoreductase